MLNRAASAKWKTAAFAAVAVLLFGLVTGTQPATAGSGSECKTSKQLGTKVPVLLVHGLGAKASDWGNKDTPGSMYYMLSGLEGVVPDTFDYASSSTEWVTNNNIGPELARRIDCLAQASRQGGGMGKVIIVAHSMGGLATRYAANQTVSGRKVADELGLVITIATPNLGSDGGNLCAWVQFAKLPIEACKGSAAPAMAPGSKELKELPRFPSGVPVKAIAGQVFVRADFFFTHIDFDFGGDLLVSVKSATDEYTARGVGDGKAVVKCFGESAIPEHSNALCEHGKLPSNPEVRTWVKASIQAYISKLPKPVLMTYLHGLGLRLDKPWQVLRPNDGTYSPSDDARTLVIDPTKCGQMGYKPYCPGFMVVDLKKKPGYAPYGRKEVGECSADGLHDDTAYEATPKLVGRSEIGGVSAEHRTQRMCGGDLYASGAHPTADPNGDVMHSWVIPSRGILIFDTDVQSNKPVSGLEDLLKTAVWK